MINIMINIFKLPMYTYSVQISFLICRCVFTIVATFSQLCGIAGEQDLFNKSLNPNTKYKHTDTGFSSNTRGENLLKGPH